jgi:hypothetical protein
LLQGSRALQEEEEGLRSMKDVFAMSADLRAAAVATRRPEV